MIIDRKYVAHLTRQRYLQYIKMFPSARQQRTTEYTMIVLSLITISLLGIFAINPTITTILELRRQYADAAFVEKRLEEKITSMSILQQKYKSLGDDLGLVTAAVPDTPEQPALIGQVQTLAQKTGITITGLGTADVLLASGKKSEHKITSYLFSLQAQGSYQQIDAFLTGLTSFDRLVLLNSFAIRRDESDRNTLILSILGKAYVKE